MRYKIRLKEWFNRYTYAELAASSTALLCSQLLKEFNPITAAYYITFAEYVAFYIVIVRINYRQLNKKNGNLIPTNSWRKAVTMVKNLVLEFGYPVVLDLLVVRPFCMYTFPMLTGNALTGVIIGKITADIVFYFFTIVNYELLKKKM
jgi:hypothetical protein